MTSLVAKNINKSFGTYTALNNINIEAESGEFLVLLGPSGCGKSTLLNMIAGLESVSEGEIIIGDQIVNDLDPKDRDIAMVFQSYALYPSMTVRENMSFGMKVRGVPKSEQAVAIEKVAKILQLEPMLERRPSQLSGGQRQRVAMGRALVRDPKVFLFDEPLSNLDAKLRVEMRTEIKKLHANLDVTVVYVTHDQIEAMTLATKVVVMKEARVQQIGTPQEIYDQPRNTYVAGFIGSPPMNLIPAEITEEKGQLVGKINRRNMNPIHVPIRVQGQSGNLRPGRKVLLGIRPENITQSNQSEDSSEKFPFDVNVEVIEPTGADDLVVLTLGGVEVTARLRPGTSKAGDTHELSMDLQRVVLFDPESGDRVDQ
jgi:multiple sugar transport system ATP-binding protein